ncbi:flagellar hook-length control protein FliK [Campylobacter jejuni]|nr:flagellar hook-length control protein FliK [Campylobacter jejuni]
MSGLNSQNDILNLAPTKSQTKQNKGANLKDDDKQEFLSSLIQAIDEKNEILPQKLNNEQKQELANEVFKQLQNGTLSQDDQISIFESANFMQILGLLDVLKMDSKAVNLNQFSQKTKQILSIEKNLNILKNAKDLNELLDLAKKLDLNIEKIKVDRLVELKNTFPNLDKAGFFNNNIESVLKDFINQKIANLIKEIPQKNQDSFTKKPQKENILSKALQDINLKQKAQDDKENDATLLNQKDKIISTDKQNHLENSKKINLNNLPKESVQEQKNKIFLKNEADLKIQQTTHKDIEKNIQNTKKNENEILTLNSDKFHKMQSVNKKEENLPKNTTEILNKNEIFKNSENIQENISKNKDNILKENILENPTKNLKNTNQEIPQNAKNIVKDLKDLETKTNSLNNTKNDTNANKTHTINEKNPISPLQEFFKSEQRENKNTQNQNINHTLNNTNSTIQNIQTKQNSNQTLDFTQQEKNTDLKNENNNTKDLQNDAFHNELNNTLKELSKVSQNQIKNPIKETFSHFSEDLKEQIQNYKAPITKVNITLNPSNLGEVEVTLMQRGNNLHINFNSNTNTMNLFIQHQAEFKNSLVNMGFTGLEMNFSDQGKKEQNGQQKSKHSYKNDFEIDKQDKELELVLAKYF